VLATLDVIRPSVSIALGDIKHRSVERYTESLALTLTDTHSRTTLRRALYTPTTIAGRLVVVVVRFNVHSTLWVIFLVSHLTGAKPDQTIALSVLLRHYVILSQNESIDSTLSLHQIYLVYFLSNFEKSAKF